MNSFLQKRNKFCMMSKFCKKTILSPIFFFQQNDTNFNSIDFLQSSSFLAKMTPNQRVFIVEDFEIRSFCGKKIQRKMTWKQNLNTPLFVGGVQKLFFILILQLLRPGSTA